jgi:hypothetical protein
MAVQEDPREPRATVSGLCTYEFECLLTLQYVYTSTYGTSPLCKMPEPTLIY